MANAIYRLLALVSCFSGLMAAGALTFTDLMLDKSVNDRYKTAKVLYYSLFTHDEGVERDLVPGYTL